ncbi:MAG: hypothetical protein ACFB0A_14945 [Croceivirga sp.]
MTRLLLFFFWLPVSLNSQNDCLLGIGGKDHETIRRVFQLSEIQSENMLNWAAELQFRNEVFERRANTLLKMHAQSSPEDLMKMSFEYKAMLDSIQANIKLLDKRLLGIFTDEQYNLYIMLCNQVSLSPIYTTRSINEK